MCLENLRPDKKYITSWISAGWTNDVMTYANLIYLGLITDRIPIIPMFIPSHVGSSVPPVPFGEVFDVPRLRNAIGVPVLEWRDVKDSDSDYLDEIGCWNTWETVQYYEHYPRGSSVPGHLQLDISYTKGPSWLKLIPDYEHDKHATFWALATLAFPEGRTSNLGQPLPSPQHQVAIHPDEQLLCYDYLYYVCAREPFEFMKDYSPAWRSVAQHMHWAPPLQNVADAYLRRALGIAEGAEIPYYIAIHVRHLDFASYCNDLPLDQCFASLPVIARRVQEVKDELLAERGIVVEHVIMTSDEKNATWWEDVRTMGWATVDHSQTVELYGGWYPVFIDAVIQSSGVGFVGTARSTMSLMAQRRVESWAEGATRTVEWGFPGADDH
ncbi:hypothetical protein FISHEDRAFT_45371 [Fistulina hepatica ATCC 64428]|uniref:Uncharacterized protein n=1 Tax=Fistulina hepatica ATCC 64428 TaxID=1128425 RepID=A0A0D7AAF7_9AGAR|nr:hypothetical protein FISHEDRAFT_45371 [Fistulina hepatica ATCC 64428]